MQHDKYKKNVVIRVRQISFTWSNSNQYWHVPSQLIPAPSYAEIITEISNWSDYVKFLETKRSKIKSLLLLQGKVSFTLAMNNQSGFWFTHYQIQG